jgi:hypothetical protein
MIAAVIAAVVALGVSGYAISESMAAKKQAELKQSLIGETENPDYVQYDVADTDAKATVLSSVCGTDRQTVFVLVTGIDAEYYTGGEWRCDIDSGKLFAGCKLYESSAEEHSAVFQLEIINYSGADWTTLTLPISYAVLKPDLPASHEDIPLSELYNMTEVASVTVERLKANTTEIEIGADIGETLGGPGTLLSAVVSPENVDWYFRVDGLDRLDGALKDFSDRQVVSQFSDCSGKANEYVKDAYLSFSDGSRVSVTSCSYFDFEPGDILLLGTKTKNIINLSQLVSITVGGAEYKVR